MEIEISLGEHLETVLNGDPLAKQTVDNRRFESLTVCPGILSAGFIPNSALAD
jgi:hypothetical protein